MNGDVPAVFTPDNEPYLGRESLLQLDEVIVSALKDSDPTPVSRTA
jgi:hypothetical protein